MSTGPCPARWRTTLLATLVLPLAAGACGRPPPPHVLFVVIDTLGADHLSCYGYPWETTPHLDALAREGALFLDCTAQSNWTMPSMISLMTGEAIFHRIYRIPGEVPVVAERFAEAGYRTGAFVANSLLAPDAGFARGVDVWDARQKGRRYWTAGDINTRALEFLDTLDDRPFFLWLHYLDTHHPYEPPSTPFQRDLDDLFDEQGQALIQQVIDQADPDERTFLSYQPDLLAKDVDRYDGEVHYVDSSIGQVLDALAARGLRENTLVVVVADHGEGLYRRPEHPDRVASLRTWKTQHDKRMLLADYLQQQHGYWMNEELIRTPFILAGPGLDPGQRIEALVSNLDVVPTVLGLCGLPPSTGPGRDLSPALRAGTPVPSAPWVASASEENMAAKTPDGRKVILPSEDMSRRHGFVPQLFDLRSDPLERLPLPPDGSAQALFERLREARRLDRFRPYSGEADEETVERLRELGYLR